jgi:hypothetical protein
VEVSVGVVVMPSSVVPSARVASWVDLDGNILEVHVHVAFGQFHPEAWRRWTRCKKWHDFVYTVYLFLAWAWAWAWAFAWAFAFAFHIHAQGKNFQGTCRGAFFFAAATLGGKCCTLSRVEPSGMTCAAGTKLTPRKHHTKFTEFVARESIAKWCQPFLSVCVR